MKQHMKPEHLTASKMLAFGLTASDFAVWTAVSTVWDARLSQAELAAVALAAISAMDEETQAELFKYLREGG